MLNDADGHGGGEAGEAVKDAEGLFKRLKRDVKADYTSKGQTTWRKSNVHCIENSRYLQLRAPVFWFGHNAMVRRAGKEAFITGTFIRPMRYEAEKEGSCVALDW